MLAEMIKLPQNVDGVICSASMALEGEAIDGCQKYRKMYPAGIQVAPRGWGTGLEIKDKDVKTFLDKFGDKEVLYISFGYVKHQFSTSSFITLPRY
jgi:hypothetical protein